MKKNYAILLVLCLLGTSLMAQTVSSSTLEFKYCKASYGSATKHVNINDFTAPYVWEGLTWEEGGTKVVTKVNSRGCDSIITYTLDVYTPCSKPFSVSASQQIYFSPGNLQYQGSSETWRFALNQWDYIGEGKGNRKTETERKTQEDWIDLFGRGTSGNGSYYPYLIVQDQKKYPTVDIAGTAYDWGIYNNAALGNPNPTWRTPTPAEWDYLINTRDTLRGKATVNGKYGLVLLPDDFDLPEHCTFSPTIKNCTTNVYTLETWILMEAAGAVFLPVTGKRTTVTSYIPTVEQLYPNGMYGYYWATGINTVGSGNNTAYYGNSLEFNHVNTTLQMSNTTRTYHGLAVRLIRNKQ